MKKRIPLIVFLAVQSIGLACALLWQRAPSSIEIVLWGTWMIFLFPGNFLGSWLIEKLFWTSHVPVLGTDLLTVAAVIAINGVLWFLVVKAFRLIFRRRYGQRTQG
jgi:hypothetical protein